MLFKVEIVAIVLKVMLGNGFILGSPRLDAYRLLVNSFLKDFAASISILSISVVLLFNVLDTIMNWEVGLGVSKTDGINCSLQE